MIQFRVGDIVRINSKNKNFNNTYGVIVSKFTKSPCYTVELNNSFERISVDKHLLRPAKSMHMFQFNIGEYVYVLSCKVNETIKKSGKITKVCLYTSPDEHKHIVYTVLLDNGTKSVCMQNDIEIIQKVGDI